VKCAQGYFSDPDLLGTVGTAEFGGGGSGVVNTNSSDWFGGNSRIQWGFKKYPGRGVICAL